QTQIQQLEQTDAADEDIYANSTYSRPKKPKAAAPRVTQTLLMKTFTPTALTVPPRSRRLPLLELH
ncbi:hypothetical protein JZ751_012905, partial [Albula glossodonta]